MKRSFIIFGFILLSSVLYSQPLLISDGSSETDSTAILVVNSTDKGMLIPRMTSTQRANISSPENGLLIFDTNDHRFWYFDEYKSSWYVVIGLPDRAKLLDTDYDTRIQVEESADEDIIRFDLSLTEIFRMEEKGRLVFSNLPESVFIGFEAGLENSGNSGLKDTYIGECSGKNTNSGSNNTAMGYHSLMANTANSYNVAIGNEALKSSMGMQNTAIGYQAGQICGDSNIFIGNQAGISETGNSTLYIDNSGTTTPLIYGNFQNKTININGKMSIGSTPFSNTKLSVLGTTEKSGFFINTKQDTDVKVLYAEYSGTSSYDAKAISGESMPNPNGNYGYGGQFIGNYMGVKAICDPGTSPGNAYAAYAKCYGSTGTRYGVYAESLGGLYRYGIYAIANSIPNSYALYCDGNGVYTGTWLSTSDKKLKRNINPIHNTLEKLTKLTPSSYEFRTSEFPYMNLANGNQFGLIAQELETVYPELVSTVSHPKSQSKDSDFETFKAINYIGLIPILSQAIIDQQKLIDKKQAVINELTSRLEILETF